MNSILRRLCLGLVAVNFSVIPTETISAKPTTSPLPIFRFNLTVEPSSVDPTRISSSESNYLVFNVLRGLYIINKDGRAEPEIAKLCTWTKHFSKLRCEIKSAKWSDGEPIRAIDFVESWRRLLLPTTKGLGIVLIQGIKNAAKISEGKLPPESLGVLAVSDRILEVTLESEDRDFVQSLAHPALAATRTGFAYNREHATTAPYSGPYRVAEWSSNQRLSLEPNPHYKTIQPNHSNRPSVEVLVIEDDETALNLYREGTLTFLRRLPTHYLKNWIKSPELFQIPVARFDYLGFGPNLRNETDFRKALATSLNFEELKLLYSALGTPGCPSISNDWMKQVPCLKFDVKAAQNYWKRVPSGLKNKRWVINYSKLGGDDIEKGMIWVQNQWKTNLGLNVELKATEQGVYLHSLRTNPPDIFRKGVGLDRATCISAVEIFTKKNAENFIKLDLPEYEIAVEKLRNASNDKQRQSACTEVVKILVDRAEVIPLGRIHFSILAKPNFKGWTLNALNQLDLSQLRSSP